MKKVAVLMSGGVDSSTSAYILLKEGYNVFGVTLKLWNCDEVVYGAKQICCSPKDIYDAKNVCSSLGIKHYVLDFSKEFKEYIIDTFCKKYLSGFTPNPCILCNDKIKFELVFERLKNLFDIDFIASGHYAKIIKFENKYFIAKAKDEFKDQSYFLCRLSSKILPYIIFPLEDFSKDKVREIAKSAGIKVADKKESFDLCFVPNGDYRKFLKLMGHEINKPGKIIDINTGKFLGYHKGYVNYTVGQRCGLGLKNVSSRMYVVKIEPKENIVYVGRQKDLYKDFLVAKDCVFYEKKEKIFKQRLFAKIRYKSELAECKVEPLGTNTVKVKFFIPQRAITPGQYVVVYDEENKILLSGEIVNSS
jgi:tRNA-specific 2-thiouridylase